MDSSLRWTQGWSRSRSPTAHYRIGRDDSHIHKRFIEDGKLRFGLNAPDSLSPGSYHDWTKQEPRFPTRSRFYQLLDISKMKTPAFHTPEHGHTLDVPGLISE